MEDRFYLYSVCTASVSALELAQSALEMAQSAHELARLYGVRFPNSVSLVVLTLLHYDVQARNCSFTIIIETDAVDTVKVCELSEHEEERTAVECIGFDPFVMLF